MDIDNIPAYVSPEGVDVDNNEFALDVNDPESIASVLQYIIDNFDDFIGCLYKRLREGDTFDFVVPDNNGQYISIRKTRKHDLYDEEAFASVAVGYPELHPLLAELAKKIIIASYNQRTSGPWATCETILGQFIVPAIAEQSEEYLPLLKTFMEANVEIRCSSHFQEWFEGVWESACEKLGVDPDDFEEDDEEEDGDDFDDDDSFGDPDEMYIDVSDAIETDWDEMMDNLLNSGRIKKETKKQLENFIEESREYQYCYILFDNGILCIATNQDGDEVYLNQPYISLDIKVGKFAYALENAAGISRGVDNYTELDLPAKLYKTVYEFLAENGYDAEAMARENINYVSYNEDDKIPVKENVQLPADTDFSDTSIDGITPDYEIWHNTPLINKVLSALLNSNLTDDEMKVIKHFIADIPNYTDMYLSKVMTYVIIGSYKNVGKKNFKFQTISFMFGENMLSVLLSNRSSFVHVLTSEEKKSFSKLFKQYKPEWVK